MFFWNSSPGKKYDKHDKVPKLTIRSPVKSPIKSPVKTPVKTPEKVELSTPTPETIHVSPQMPSPTKMVRRSQVSRQNSSNASTQASSGRVKSLRVPSQVNKQKINTVISTASLSYKYTSFCLPLGYV